MAAKHVDDSSFKDEVLNSDVPVLVDFFAPWCGPCKMMAPTIDELAGEVEGKAKVVKLDVDEAPETAGKYGVQSIPTLIAFKGGQPVSSKIGVVNKDELLEMLGL